MLIFKYLNQPQNELQKDFIKQVENTDLNQYLNQDQNPIYEVKFLENDQVLINKDKIDIKIVLKNFKLI